MKKLVKALEVSILALSAFALFSCADETGDDYNYAADTVITLDAPKVTAKAYPGVNYIYWEPVASANSYALYRSDGIEDIFLTTIAKDSASLSYEDIAKDDYNLINGKTYKYTVVAVSKSDVARSVVAQSSKASASVKANVPAFGTATLDLNSNYAKKFTDTNLANNTKVAKGNDGYIYASFPAINGVKYEIVSASEAEETKYEAENGKAFSTSLTTGSTTAKYNFSSSGETVEYKSSTPVTADGTYNVYLVAKSVSELYPASVVKLSSIEIESLNETTSLSSATATYTASKTVTVTWTPAQINDEEDYTNYKVYRYANYTDKVYVAVNATPAKLVESSTTVGGSSATVDSLVYVQDTVEDDTISYTYLIVHTDGTYYGSSSATATLGAITETQTVAPTLSVETYIDGTDNLKDTIKITSKKGNEYQTLALSYVKLSEDADGDAVSYVTSDFSSLTLTNYAGLEDTYINYIPNADSGTYLIKLVASETGYKDNEVYEVIEVSSGDVDISSVTLSISGTTATITDSIDYYSTTDSISNYTYILKQVKIYTPSLYNKYVIVETTSVLDSSSSEKLNLTYPDGVTTYAQATRSVDQSTTGTSYSYYVIKALASDSSVYATTALTSN